MLKAYGCLVEQTKQKIIFIFFAKFLKDRGGAASFRCRSRDLVLVGVQRYAREPKRG